MNNEKIREKKILEYLKSIQRRRNYYDYYDGIADEIGETLKNAKISCSYLYQKGLVRYWKIDTYARNGSWPLRITAEGEDALQTIYNPEWVKLQENEKVKEKDLREREVKASESSHLWTKIGTISAIVMSVIAIMISLFK